MDKKNIQNTIQFKVLVICVVVIILLATILVLNKKESNVNDCMQPNLYKPTSKCPERKIFWKRYKKYGIKYILKKYGRYTVRWKIKRKIWKIFLKNV